MNDFCPIEWLCHFMNLNVIIPSLLTLLVAGIALQQFLLAKEKFKLDLFEKRFAVFKGIELFVYELRFNNKFTHDIFFKFNTDTQTASFIFDEEIKIYISDIRTKGRDLKYLYDCIRDLPVGDERHILFLKIESILNELEQMESQLPVKFAPYLKFRKWKHGLIWELR